MDYESLVYPPQDAPLMEAYCGRYESLYVILHPFVGVPGELAWKTTKNYPDDEQIARVGEKHSWSQVAAHTGMSTCAKLNQALLTTIGSINKELCDFAGRDALKGFLESEPVWMPTEGRFEPLLQMDFLNVFEAAGQKELIFVPEFPNPKTDPIQRLDLASLRSRKVPFPTRGTLAAADGSFLLTVDWDSFFTLFYGPRDFVTDVVRCSNLEGFFATPFTEHFWFNYALGCCVITLSPEDWPVAEDAARQR
ncbi:MAG: DUF2711 family protein [Terracidiphilus sp.]|nr:DUF2711 family protein [Terracidiphilus sp.]